MEHSDLGQLAVYSEPTGVIEDQTTDLSYSSDVNLALSESNAFAFGTTNPYFAGQTLTLTYETAFKGPLTDALDIQTPLHSQTAGLPTSFKSMTENMTQAVSKALPFISAA